MAKVEPGSQTPEVYSSRGIVIQSNEGDAYYIRKQTTETFSDKRSKKNVEQTPSEKMDMVARIWQGKPACWKDHFFRSKKTFTYGHWMSGQTQKELSGYQLGINMLLGSLNYKDGTYYNPVCFCLQPTDMIGQEMHVDSKCQIVQLKDVEYNYNETHRLIQRLQDGSTVKNPFRSAVENVKGSLRFFQLFTTYCLPYNTDYFYGDPHLEQKHHISSPFPIRLKPVNNSWPYDIPVWEKEKWIYFGNTDVGTISSKLTEVNEDLPEPIVPSVPIPDESVNYNYVAARFQDPSNPDTMCGMEGLKIEFFYHPDILYMLTTHHTMPPLWDLYYGDLLIGRVGSGPGEEKLLHSFIPSTNPDPVVTEKLNIYDDFKPVPVGRQDYHHKIMKIHEPTSYEKICGAKCEGGTDACSQCNIVRKCDCSEMPGWQGIDYYYGFDDLIYPSTMLRDPEIMLKFKTNCYDDRGFQCWYPWSSCTINTTLNGVTVGQFTGWFREIIVVEGQYRYCLSFEGSSQPFNGVHIHISNTLAGSGCVKSILADMDGCKIMQKYDWFL